MFAAMLLNEALKCKVCSNIGKAGCCYSQNIVVPNKQGGSETSA